MTRRVVALLAAGFRGWWRRAKDHQKQRSFPRNPQPSTTLAGTGEFDDMAAVIGGGWMKGHPGTGAAAYQIRLAAGRWDPMTRGSGSSGGGSTGASVSLALSVAGEAVVPLVRKGRLPRMSYGGRIVGLIAAFSRGCMLNPIHRC